MADTLRPHADVSHRGNTLDPRISTAMRVMAMAVDQPLTLPELARGAGLSLSHFCHLFRRETGVSPKRALADIRVRRAKALLAFTNTPVKEIAVKVGMSRVDTFTRFFRMECGMAPGEYRQIVRHRGSHPHTQQDWQIEKQERHIREA